MTDHDLEHDSRDLLLALTAVALDRAAPEELILLDETAAEYFADPGALLNPRHRDEPVGFGVDVGLLTPYVLAVATPVVSFLLDTVRAAAQDAAKPWAIRTARRLILGADRPNGDRPLALTAEQIRRARTIAYDQARRLGLADEKSALLADSVAGGLIRQP